MSNNEWTSVEDLPIEDKDVDIAHITLGWVSVGSYVTQSNNQIDWYDAFDRDSLIEPTHWKDRPEPPKEPV